MILDKFYYIRTLKKTSLNAKTALQSRNPSHTRVEKELSVGVNPMPL